MRIGSRGLAVQLFCVAALTGLMVVDVVVHADQVAAQMQGGEFALYQPGEFDPVGWARVNGDRSVEWWAYVADRYSWADSTNALASPWHLEARHVGSGNWSTYASWKADVLQRAAAQGHTIVFQDHSVVEESVEN